MASVVETISAPTNIAVIKYWGKEDVALNTPINSSVSVTLSQDDLRTITSAAANKNFTCDRVWLNGKEQDVQGNKRLLTVFREMRRLAQDRVGEDGSVIISKEEWKDYNVHIVSENTFPTAAGLASSASGYAGLVYVLARLFNAVETYDGEFTVIARQGSGSACRSLYGGFVRWQKGVNADSTDSKAIQIASESHWPELEILVCVVNATQKEVSSTSGMQRSVATSPLLAYRAAQVVEQRLEDIETAYRKKDFPTFAKIMMQDSNQFHATCLDTYPPIFYLTDVSKSIISLIHKYNEACGEIRAGYTFDAGPNAVIIARRCHIVEVFQLLLCSFGGESGTSIKVNKPHLQTQASKHKFGEEIENLIATIACRDGIEMIYHTTVGDGPRSLSPSACLLNHDSGLPL